jgi:hypothetical protein
LFWFKPVMLVALEQPLAAVTHPEYLAHLGPTNF